MVSVGYAQSFGGGLRIAEGARLDDGMLDVIVIKPMSRGSLVRTYPKLFKGHPYDAPAVRAPPVPQGDRGLARGSRRTPTASGSETCRSPASALPGRSPSTPEGLDRGP